MQEVKNICLPDLVERHGVRLKKSGGRFVGLCPFHNEKTGSFFIFPNNHFHCFGCGESGDAATFIMKSHGCTFPEALEKLGIQKSDKPWSPVEKAEFKKNRLKQQLIADFRKWESRYSSELGKLICAAHTRLLKVKTDADLIKNEWIYDFLPGWKYHLDILCYGSDQDKLKLFREVR